MTGRLPITHAAHILFVVASAVGGGSVNMSMLTIARFIMGVASSVPCTVGGGFIADLMPVEERGRAMTLWTVGLLLVCILSICPIVKLISPGVNHWAYFRRLHGALHRLALDHLA